MLTAMSVGQAFPAVGVNLAGIRDSRTGRTLCKGVEFLLGQEQK